MRTLPLAFLLLGGCWLSGDELDAKLEIPDDTAVTADPLVLSALAPRFGPDSGGTTVDLAVGPILGDSPVVQFGNVDASIVSFDEDGITVLAPAQASPGPVAVSIMDGDRRIHSEGAYTYHPDQSGLNGVLGSMTYIEYVGDAWGTQIARPDDFGFAWLSFVAPTPVTYVEMFHGAGMDSCQREYVWTGTLTDQPIGATEASLYTGANSLTLPFNSTGLQFESDLTIAQYRPGSTFDLAAFDSQSFPAFETPGIVRTPLPFSVTQPEFDLFVNSSFDVTWTTAETGDYALIRVDLYDNAANAFIETVRCVVADDGRFHIDSSEFTQWVPFTQTARIWVGRVIESDAVLAHDGSSSGVVGVYWIIGLADTDI